MTPTYEQRSVERLVAKARRMRAQAMADTIVAAGRGLARLALALVRMIRQWHERATLAAELYGMSDHDLADIGLSRCDVDAVVRGGYRGERRPAVRRPLLVPVHPDIRRVKVERITGTRQAA